MTKLFVIAMAIIIVASALMLNEIQKDESQKKTEELNFRTEVISKIDSLRACTDTLIVTVKAVEHQTLYTANRLYGRKAGRK